MRSAGFSLSETQDLKFICSNDAWVTAKLHSSEFFPGSEVKETRRRPVLLQ